MGVTRRIVWPLLALLAVAFGCDTLFPKANGVDGDADSDVDLPEEICSNDCFNNYDEFCDDGGRGAVTDWCAFGTDCEDCGVRHPRTCIPFCGEEGDPWLCGWDECGGSCGECPRGMFCDAVARDCTPCYCGAGFCGINACWEWCNCGVGQRCTGDPPSCVACTCESPGECGYDFEGCYCGGCATGYCNAATELCDPAASQLCNESCLWAQDGVCDDGGLGCTYIACEFGSDCSDCGVRTEADRRPIAVPCPG